MEEFIQTAAFVIYKLTVGFAVFLFSILCLIELGALYQWLA
jgi:hypothetical protein